jgi:BlaI family penicillinase repressor
VREIHDELSKEKDLGYTSALKLLQIMTTKGLVTRTEEQRAHVYTASDPAETTKQLLASDVLQRVFRGSASQLMQHALSGRRSSKKELDEIRRLLDEYERKNS